ncbi:MAG: hypothetical protein LZF86_160037 [Nitrospira sp.]|nr:MAG: hypothetical protein LZF86_160037 [Nitrospira sp.]
MLNRAALIVRPKQPFLDWAAGLDDSGLVPDIDGEKAVYLIPEFESDEEGLRILRRIYAEIFERELDGWHTDPSAWPQKRDFKTFQQWFSIELHSVIEDVVDDLLVDDDLEA